MLADERNTGYCSATKPSAVENIAAVILSKKIIYGFDFFKTIL